MDLFVFKDCNPEVFWSCKTSKYFVLCLNRCFWWKICEGHPIHIWRKSIVYTDLIAILTAAVRDFGSEVEAIERCWTEGLWEVMSSSRRPVSTSSQDLTSQMGSKLKNSFALQHMKREFVIPKVTARWFAHSVLSAPWFQRILLVFLYVFWKS